MQSLLSPLILLKVHLEHVGEGRFTACIRELRTCGVHKYENTGRTHRTGVQRSTWSTESTGTLGEHRTVENGREHRVQCSTWSTESTGTLGEHRER